MKAEETGEATMPNGLVIIPTFNEAKTLPSVLLALRQFYCGDVLVVDDGSTDQTQQLLGDLSLGRLEVRAHHKNQGYGAALISGFEYALQKNYAQIVTMDCDWQHEPEFVPHFFRGLEDVDIVSGSRYLDGVEVRGSTPDVRRGINQLITKEINFRLGLSLTDSFCGFKGYRASALRQMSLNEPGYAFPLQLWAQAARLSLTIKELGVPRVYLDQKRSFGPYLDDPDVRLKLYREVLNREIDCSVECACS